ncbi:unnamed protein product [Rotaria sp. Silwood2]|nr:unnamed protein product [Rotaria sp. Silwood2]CAF2934392.1 unnamed protein product [Rotaria sp. Silwood2]CAF3331766.1 unnamed protein product [Rotaria sp. Silwood2]CAF3917055.1 unnamed protein product [Rotaria sp. Silwood2]CAF4223316.1 unnamed protein product [Rotaria sp. Silwood2]
MSHFLILLIGFILCPDYLNSVQIVGLFPDHHDAPSQCLNVNQNCHWITQSKDMFNVAITLANRYEIYVDGYPINGSILLTNASSGGFDELELVCRLITNTTALDVVGVVGPTSSSSARYLAPFAARVHLPLVSYTATNADLDDKLSYPTFYRTIPSDILAAEAIAKLFKYFSWITCSIIIGNDDYGYGGLKILSEVYYVNISIQERLVFDPRVDKFQADLKQTLEKSRSRIVLVWANDSSSTRIIQHALNASLLGKNYVWITTNKIDLNTFEQNEWLYLNGILTVVPFIGNSSAFGINETLRKEAFDIWRNLSHNIDDLSEFVSSVSLEAMYTFDAVWALIQALNKSVLNHKSPSMNKSLICFDNLLQNHDEYLLHLKDTRFSGVSGSIQFSKINSSDRMHGAMYGLYNVQSTMSKKGKEKRLDYIKVLTWYETSRNWTNSTDENNTFIIWPNHDNTKVPADYPQLRGQHLRILVLEAPPFVIVQNSSTYDQSSNYAKNLERVNFHHNSLKVNDSKVLVYGFVADFIRELQAQMHFTYTVYVADPSTAYHSLVALLAEDNHQYDIILSNIAMTSDRMLKVDFSTPFHENTFRIITRLNQYSSSLSLFSCFNPFTWDVWAAIFTVMIYSSIIIYIFEFQNRNIDNSQSKLKTTLIGIGNALTSLLIMSNDIRLTTTSSRLTVLGIYILGIILGATYTANLSSILTLHRGQPFISGIDDIKNGLLPFSRIGIVTNSAISDYYIRNISTEYHSLATVEDIYLRLLDHAIDASIWDSSILEYAVNNYYCNELTVTGVGFVKSSFAIVLPKNWLYKTDLDVNIVTLRESEKLESLENVWMNDRTCSSSSSSLKQTDGPNSKTFSLNVLGGIFLTFFIITVIAFAVHIWHCRVAIISTLHQIIQRIRLVII